MGQKIPTENDGINQVSSHTPQITVKTGPVGQLSWKSWGKGNTNQPHRKGRKLHPTYNRKPSRQQRNKGHSSKTSWCLGTVSGESDPTEKSLWDALSQRCLCCSEEPAQPKEEGMFLRSIWWASTGIEWVIIPVNIKDLLLVIVLE